MDTSYLLEMKDISKSFPGVKALDHAGIRVKKGEVHALVGENGAGKSTIMKVLNGLVIPDEGEIIFDGNVVKISSPAEALHLGIAMIYQELNVIPDMTVYENIFIGKEFVRNKWFLDDKQAKKKAKELLQQFGLSIDPLSKMRSLSLAQQQMIEIMKAAFSGAKLIVMDEPTSSLTESEIRMLFDKIKELKNNGVSIIYISHRMEEIFEIADMVTVMRDGKFVGERLISEVDEKTMINMMVGRTLDTIFPKVDVEIGETALSVENLSGDRFKNISFSVRAGEILGFYGLLGAGRSEVMRSIFGLDPHTEGKVLLYGKELNIKDPSDSIKEGIAMVTEDRRKYGLVLTSSIGENIELPNWDTFSSGPFLQRAKANKASLDISKKLSVKMRNLSQISGNLSGGNQQKVILCKWMMKNPKVLILDEPTRGIDVGAKAEIHALMGDFVKAGMAIILISSELPEVIGMSDRVLVMGEGSLKGEFARKDCTQEKLLNAALGGTEE